MHNHASSRVIGLGIAVLIVGPELCSKAWWEVVNKRPGDQRQATRCGGAPPPGPGLGDRPERHLNVVVCADLVAEQVIDLVERPGGSSLTA
jgi:hypothetical protein